jgi:hypothetical protein
MRRKQVFWKTLAILLALQGGAYACYLLLEQLKRSHGGQVGAEAHFPLTPTLSPR